MAVVKDEEVDAYSKYEEIFKKGSIVEVSSEDSGLRGSWYTATVIRTISRKTNKILVEYHNLMADDAGSKPLREYIPAVLVRPIPPREPHRLFAPMDDVDAFHNDGWWEGVVTSVNFNATSNSYSYSVFFRCSREQIQFYSSDLRLHREWVPHGNLWVPPLLSDTNLLLHASPPNSSSGQRKRNGEDLRNGYHSSGDKDRVTRNGGKRSVSTTPTKKNAVFKNGGCKEERRSSTRSVNNHVVASIKKDEGLRICSNGVRKKNGLASNGRLIQSRRRASK